MFTAVGPLSQYVKGMVAQNKAMQKLYTPGNLQNGVNDAKSIFSLPAQTDKSEKDRVRIYAKLRRGEELNAAELNYLRKHAPDLYAKAVKVAEERKEFKDKLKSCKTKEEKRRLKLHSLMAAASEKDEDMMTMRTNAINNVYSKQAGDDLPENEQEANKDSKKRRKERANKLTVSV